MDQTGRASESARARTNGGARPVRRPGEVGDRALRRVPTRDLVGEVARKASELVRMELELAKAEVRQDVRTEVRMVAGLGAGVVCALLGLAMLLVALVFGLAAAGLPGWGAALVVAGGVLAIGAAAAAWGWARRVRRPLDTTRRSLEENVRWAKGRFA